VERFCAMVRDYGAGVHRTTARELPDTLGRLIAERGLRRLVIPPDLPPNWRPEGFELLEDRDLDLAVLDGIDGVVSGCATAIAQTGTIVLDGGARSGRRAITLVPDHHLCVVESDQVVGLVPEGLAGVAPSVAERAAPITLVSGPSASSDIELNRVEGVHGPRHLEVVVVEPEAGGG
jgi:L-lactate dehydrogenase complex protein LldG